MINSILTRYACLIGYAIVFDACCLLAVFVFGVNSALGTGSSNNFGEAIGFE